MKQFLTVFFSIFYLLFSSGSAFAMHYCMGDISVSRSKNDGCGKCGEKEKNNCCKTTVKIIKVDEFQKAELLKFKFQPSLGFQPSIFNLSGSFKPFSAKVQRIFTNAPPDLSQPPIYLSFQNFRI